MTEQPEARAAHLLRANDALAAENTALRQELRALRDEAARLRALVDLAARLLADEPAWHALCAALGVEL